MYDRRSGLLALRRRNVTKHHKRHTVGQMGIIAARRLVHGGPGRLGIRLVRRTGAVYWRATPVIATTATKRPCFFDSAVEKLRLECQRQLHSAPDFIPVSPGRWLRNMIGVGSKRDEI